MGKHFRKAGNVKIYSINDIAQLTGKSAQTVRSWCRKNEIEREGRRYLITQDLLVTICDYYGVAPSKVSEYLGKKEKDTENLGKIGKADWESNESNPLFSQMQATIDAKQEQIDILKESLEQARADKDKELERLTDMYTALSEKYDKLQEEQRNLLQILVAERFRRLSLPNPEEKPQVSTATIEVQPREKEKKSLWKRIFG